MKDASCEPRSVVAFTPIKLGDARLPGKNTKELCGRPLLNHAIEQVDRLGIDNYIYCSDESVIDHVDSRHAKFMRRSADLDSDDTTGPQIAKDFSDYVYADVYLMYHATGPLHRTAHYAEAIKAVQGEFVAAASVSRLYKPACFRGPLNWGMGQFKPTRQMEPVTILTGIYCFRRHLIQNGVRISWPLHMVEIPPEDAVDIDEWWEFELARILMEGRGDE